MSALRSPRSDRGKRPKPALYDDLNKPIRERKPIVEWDAPGQTPRPRTPRQRKVTDTSAFTVLSDHTQSLESVMSTVRKNKTARVQAWINEKSPKPIEILRRIAQESPAHARVLNLICDELDKFPESSLRDPALAMNEKARSEIDGARARSRDIGIEMDRIEMEEDELVAALEAAKERHGRLVERLETLKYVMCRSTFTEHEKEMMERNAQHQEALMSTRRESCRDSERYNVLWCENTQLKSESKRLQELIDAERNFHREFVKDRAMKIVEAKKQ